MVALTLVFLWWMGGKPWLRHFAFPIGFFLIAVPWPTGVEGPVIQSLMGIVAASATEALKLIGIPAQLEGNLIRVSSGLVGISETCSGVRSLQTSLMIGLLLGELKRLSILRRVALVAVAAAIALAANFFRAVFLVWIAARENLTAVSRWHDFAGYSIVALVFLGTMAAAWRLIKKTESRKAKVEGGADIIDQSPESVTSSRSSATPQHREGGSLVTRLLPHPSYFILLFLWLLAIEVASAAWYRAHERNLVASTGWDVQWPRNAPRFHEIKIDEHARRILRFDRGYAASWIAAGPESQAHLGQVICSGVFCAGNPGATVRCLRICIGQMFVCHQLDGNKWRTPECEITQ